jgi:hypothetical protein
MVHRLMNGSASWRVLAVAVAFVACSSATDPFDHTLELRVGTTIASPGDQITLTVVNASSTTIRFDHCRTSLQRSGTSGWIPAQDSGCNGVAEPLAAGSSVSFAWPLDPDLAAGQYRFISIVELPGASGHYDRQLQTPTFELVGP